MNFVAFTPHFPPNYLPFWINLRRMGVNVLGLADAPYPDLTPDLRDVLTEYYYVWDCHDYDALLRSMGYFTHRYGKIDRLESHNEYWLESDARLRTDFNIFGLQNNEIARVKRKSEMKKMFQKAGLRPVRGRVCLTLDEARGTAEEYGFPIVVKPDIGVGANYTYRINNLSELEDFFQKKTLKNYIFEEFIDAQIVTFDGLTDKSGKIVFYSSMVYNGIMDIVNQALDTWYMMVREIPAEVEAAGKKIIEVYRLRERFFHLEFFRTLDGELVPLEVNMRPPGGLTTDMFNFANDMDIYAEYANIVVANQFQAKITRPYFCAYVGRRNHAPYRNDHDDIMAAFPRQVVYNAPISGVFAAAIGDYGYIVRSPDEDEIRAAVDFIHARL